MEFRTHTGRQRYDDLVSTAARAVVGLDFDGVLSPIVDDPTAAVIHPDADRVLTDLAGVVRAVAVITGRPARQAVELGDLDGVADALSTGGRLFVLGQYGDERWDSMSRKFTSPSPPAGLRRFTEDLAGLLEEHDASGAFVEDKGIAVAVHTRRLSDSQGVFARLLPALTEAAQRHGLGVEPGRLVVEIRAPGMHKGEALRLIRNEVGAEGILFAGDDLGDLEAFRAVAALREEGIPGLLVCSGSEEQQALVELSDVVVDGPTGVLGLLAGFARDARAQAG
ncbi:MAG TPA: trehalose-phosphatase [Nocardioidaceae bacterium]|nr:trehalose-phosphatase [Nocardioidaceae bacterium]